MSSNWKRIFKQLRCHFAFLLCLIAIELYGGYQCFSHGIRFQLIEVPSLQSLQVASVEVSGLYKDEMANLPWVKAGDKKQQYVGALQWTMNQVKKVSKNSVKKDPEKLLKSVKAGEGALCYQMSLLYLNALAAINLPARRLFLTSNLWGGDTHSIVEVLWDSKWIVMDPTFGVYFSNKITGDLLSAQDIKEYLFNGNYSRIQSNFIVGDVQYPARLEKYYMNFLPLYNNVFVENYKNDISFLLWLPPLRYWLGSKMYYQKIAGESDKHIKFVQRIYFDFTVIVPSIILFVAAITFVKASGLLKKMKLR